MQKQGSIAAGFGDILSSSAIKSGGMVAAGALTAKVEARLASCAEDTCTAVGDFTLCTDITGAQSCVASGIACGCPAAVSLGMSDLYSTTLPVGDVTFTGRVHGILLQQVSGSAATAAVCSAVTLPSNQATCESAQAGGRSLCTYTAANPSGVPPVVEACGPAATRMVFPNRDDPDKVLNVIFNAFFYDPYFNTPLGHTDMLLPDMPAPAWPAAQSCGNPTGTKCVIATDSASITGGGDVFISSYVSDDINNAMNVEVEGSVGVIEIVDNFGHIPLAKDGELRVHILNSYIFPGSVVVATLADLGVGGWAIVRDARVDDEGGGVVVVVKNLCHELPGSVDTSVGLPDRPDGGAVCATTDAGGQDGTVRTMPAISQPNLLKVGFAIFSSSVDEQAKDDACVAHAVQATCTATVGCTWDLTGLDHCRSTFIGAPWSVDHCDPNPCAENGDSSALCTSAEFSHTCGCSTDYGGAACELCSGLTAPASNCFEQSCTGQSHWCPSGASSNADSCVDSCSGCGGYTTYPLTFAPWVDITLAATTTRYGSTCLV